MLPTGFAIESYYGLAVSDRFHVNANRGNVEGTPRQRLLVTGTYELPFGRGRAWNSNNRFLNAVVGGWNLNTISLLQTGPWLTPTVSRQQRYVRCGIHNAARLRGQPGPRRFNHPGAPQCRELLQRHCLY